MFINELGYSAQQAIENEVASIVNFCSSEGLEVSDETVDLKDIQILIF